MESFKLLEEAIYINQVEHFVSFVYNEKEVKARGIQYFGSPDFDKLYIEINHGIDFKDWDTIDWKLNQGEISEEEHHEITELAEDLIYKLHVPHNETIHHKLYSHEQRTI